MRRFISGLFLWVAFAGFFAVALFFQNKGVQRILKNDPFYDTWQLGGRSGELMKLLALRYDMVAADSLWLRSIQSFGGRGMSNRDWRPIYNQFETITDLDPWFAEAYTFGNLVLGDEGGHVPPSLQLLDKGTFKVFRQYRIPFEAMYVGNWVMKNHNLARWYGVIATKREDAPEWVQRMVAYIDVTSGEYYIGLDRFMGNLLQAIDAEEPSYQDIALKKAAETINKWNASRMMQAADEFTSSTGRAPSSIQDILAMPALQNYETADFSKLIASVLSHTEALGKQHIPEGLLKQYVPPDAAMLQKPVDITTTQAATKKLESFQNVVFSDGLTTTSGMPPSPTGRPYAINLTRYGNNMVYKPEEIFVTEDQLETDAKSLLSQVRTLISDRRVELGRVPESLNEVFYTDFKTTEPFGGTWNYNNQTGLLQMSSRPDY